MQKEILEDFIEWLKDREEGVFYAFHETDEAIEKYMEHKEAANKIDSMAISPSINHVMAKKDKPRLAPVRAFVVEYAGFYHLQKSPFYEDHVDLLNAEHVGELQAATNAQVFADAFNVRQESGMNPNELHSAFKTTFSSLIILRDAYVKLADGRVPNELHNASVVIQKYSSPKSIRDEN